MESENAGRETRGLFSVGVIGWPIGHTVSPVMHDAAARAAGIDLTYSAYEVHPDDLGTGIAGVRALAMAGVNVTVPHKTTVIEYLDEIEPPAGEIGAVNCIVNRAGTLTGHNVDTAGFVRSLRRLLPDFEPKWALVLGAGGSARAVVHALLGMGARVHVWARDDTKARRLASELGGSRTEALSRAEVSEAASEADLVVNCTPVGMLGGPGGELPIDLGRLMPDCVVYDLVYNPLITPLLAKAGEAGLRGVNGLRMLAEQAALSFALWTGREADPALMEEAARRALGVRAEPWPRA